MSIFCSPLCFMLLYLVYCEDSGTFPQISFSSSLRRDYRASVGDHLVVTGCVFPPCFLLPNTAMKKCLLKASPPWCLWVLGMHPSCDFVTCISITAVGNQVFLLNNYSQLWGSFSRGWPALFDKENPYKLPLWSQRGFAVSFHWCARCWISLLLLPCADD